MPIAAALFDAIPRGEGGKQRGPSRTLLFNVTRGLAHRVPLTKLVELDGDVHPYLAALMVAALAWAGETLVVPEGTAHFYDDKGSLRQHVAEGGRP